MDILTRQILKNVAGAMIRAALYAIGTFLLSKGWIDADTKGQIDSNATEIAGGLLAFGLSLALSLYQKFHFNRKIEHALTLPAGTSREKLEQKT